MRILDVGCGKSKHKSINSHDIVIGVDIATLTEVDVVCDIKDGVPFKDNAFDQVIAFSVLEHLYVEDLEFVMKEFSRVGRRGGLVKIHVPHFSSPRGRMDSDHRNTNWATNTFWRYRPDDWAHYTKDVAFSVRSIRLVWHTSKWLSIPNWIISGVVNSHWLVQVLYEQCFGLPWIFPMNAIRVELEII